MCTSSRMQDGVLLRATARSAAPSAKQITSYPPADKTIERVSRTAGSSSTTKISPREVVCSAMGDCSCKERRNNKARLMIPHSVGVLGTRICTVYGPNPQVVAANRRPSSRDHDLDTISRQSSEAECCLARHIGVDTFMITSNAVGMSLS